MLKAINDNTRLKISLNSEPISALCLLYSNNNNPKILRGDEDRFLGWNANDWFQL